MEKWNVVAVTIVILVAGIYGALEQVNEAAVSEDLVFPKGSHAATARKLISSGKTKEDYVNRNENESGSMKRIGFGDASCSNDDISVIQGQTSPLPNGIPTYTVNVENVCVSSCTISDIHLSCGWFSSARLIDPSLFQRIAYDDCLVNGGQPLGPGQAVTFQYANTYAYTLSVSSVEC